VAKIFPSVSRFAAAVWERKITRPTYTAAGKKRQVEEWHARIQYGGKRRWVPLGSNCRRTAARRAADFWQHLVQSGWDEALAKFCPDRATADKEPTIGALIEAATTAGAAKGISPKTLRGYAVSLRWIAARVFGVRDTASKFDYATGGHGQWQARIDNIRLDRLTGAKVQAALDRHIAEAADNPIAERKARVSAASLLRQAKALFSPRLELPFANLPQVFTKATPTGPRPVKIEGVGKPPRYKSTIDAASLLRDGKAELATQDPEAWKALLLALGAGLRKSEIDNLTWPQIDVHKNLIRVETTATFSPKSDDSEGEVFVDAGLIRELESFRDKATGLFVIESAKPPRPKSPVPYYRGEVVYDRLAGWLRMKGILTHKPIHALRREFGSIVCASADVHTASRQLRHADIAVTSAYYLDGRKRAAPPVGAMLGTATATTAATK